MGKSTFRTLNNTLLVYGRQSIFFIIKTKYSLSTSVFIFSKISQILKRKFYIFWSQTCRNSTKLFKWTCYFSFVPHVFKFKFNFFTFLHFAKIALYFIFGTKISLSTSVFIFSIILQIWKTKFYVVWTQTWETSNQ